MSTTFSFPTPTLFGPGALAELPDRSRRLNVERLLVVTDAGLLSTAAFAALSRVLGDSDRDKRWFVYSGVHPNPVEDDVKEAAAVFRQQGCDGVIAIGGGSALD